MAGAVRDGGLADLQEGGGRADGETLLRAASDLRLQTGPNFHESMVESI